MADDKLVKLNSLAEMEWGQVVDALLAEFNDVDHLPGKAVQAMEMLLAGYPTYKAAAKVGVSAQTVRRWMSAYPTMAAVLAEGKKMLTKWRMARIEQQFLAAIERSQEVLEVPLSGITADGERVDPKVLTVVAAQARYIIGLFAGQRVDVTVTHELGDTVLKARQDALDYVARRLSEQRDADEPVEVEYRVIDSKIDDSGPMLNEHGSPPFGELGKLDATPDGILCHICGGRFKSLARHLLTRHNATTEEYELLYMLAEGEVRKTEKY